MTHKHLSLVLSVLMSMVASVTSADTHEYVDLGLPSGTLWATCNIGADSPEEYGDYFAWGETVPYGGTDESNAMNYSYAGTYTKTYYDWSTYKYCYGWNKLTKYCYVSSCGYNGFTDNLTELVSGDDAATANWGTEWQMPSYDQFNELINSSYTTTEWTTLNGVYGYKITSKVSGYVGNFVFLPVAWCRYGSSLVVKTGPYGYYWSRSLITDDPFLARYLNFNSSYIRTSNYDGMRSDGQSVRPVRVSPVVTSIALVDGNPFTNDTDKDMNELTYTRTFSNTDWQALYVPFEMQYEDWKDDFEVARINNVNQYDDDEDGNVDRTVLEVFKVKSGQTEAHTPYLIKAKTTGEKTIFLTNATLYRAEEKSYDVSSWNTLYTFTGTYTGVSGATMFGEGYYALGSGSLHQAADTTNSLSPMRWYMAVTDRDGNPKNLGEVKVMVFGMEEDELIETGLEEVGRDAISTNEQPVFDLNGRRVTNPRKGLYIKNGKKFVVK